MLKDSSWGQAIVQDDGQQGVVFNRQNAQYQEAGRCKSIDESTHPWQIELKADKLLVEDGANTNIKDKDGNTPLQVFSSFSVKGQMKK